MNIQTTTLRHVFFLITGLFANTINAFSQTYIGMDIGYGLPIGAKDMPDGNSTYFPNGFKETTLFKVSFGAGRTYSFSTHHEISSKMAISCRVTYLQGDKYKKTVTGGALKGLVDQYSSNMVWFIPHIRLKSPKIKRLSPYMEIGPCFGWLGKVISEREYIRIDNKVIEQKFVHDGGITYGISTAVGGSFRVFKSDKLKLNTEIRIIGASFAPKQVEFVSEKEDGKNVLVSLPGVYKKSIYKKNYVIDPSNPPDPSMPGSTLQRYFPFSSLAFNIGLSYRLSE